MSKHRNKHNTLGPYHQGQQHSGNIRDIQYASHRPVPQNYDEHEEFFASLEWEAYEYTHHERTSDWFWAVGILTVGLFAVAIIMSNYLFALFILLAGFTVMLYGAKQPRKMTFTLTHNGIQVDNKLYLYDSLKSFWIFYNPPLHKELSLETEKALVPHIRIPLDDMDPVEVRRHLLKFLPEKRQEESLIEIMSHYVRF